MKGILCSSIPLFVLLVAFALTHAAELEDGSSGVRHARHATPEEIGTCAQASCAPAVDDDEVILLARALPASKETIARRPPTIGQPTVDSARQPNSSFAAIQQMKGHGVVVIVLAFFGVLACGALIWRVFGQRSKGSYEMYEDETSSWDANEAWVRTGHRRPNQRQPAAATILYQGSDEPPQQLPPASSRGRQRDARSDRGHDPTYVPGVGRVQPRAQVRQQRSPRDASGSSTAYPSNASAPAASSGSPAFLQGRDESSRSSSSGGFVDPLDEMATKVNAAGTQVFGFGQRAAYGVGNMGTKVLKTVDKAAKPLTSEVKDQKKQLEYRWQRAREGNVG